MRHRNWLQVGAYTVEKHAKLCDIVWKYLEKDPEGK